MNMPGFTADASLGAGRPYQGAYIFQSGAGGVITPQFCNFECLTDCYSDCLDLPVKYRTRCFAMCRRECCH